MSWLEVILAVVSFGFVAYYAVLMFGVLRGIKDWP